jgi:hypothetical protein
MKVTQYRYKTRNRSSSGSLLTCRCSDAFVDEVKRSAFLIVILSVIVVLATGCFTTGTGSSARLISLIPASYVTGKPQTGDNVTIGPTTYNSETQSFDRPWPFGPESSPQ